MATGALWLLVVLVSTAALTQAVAPRATVLKAPYLGAKSQATNYWTTKGCAHARNIVLAHWNASTGRAVAFELAHATSCASQINGYGSSSGAAANGELVVSIPIPILNSGPRAIMAHENVAFLANATAIGGKCGPVSATDYGCDSVAYWDVFATAYLLDLTNHSVFWSTSRGGWSSQAYVGEFYSSGNWSNLTRVATPGVGGHVTFYVNGTLDHRHRYVLVVDLRTLAEAFDMSSRATFRGASAAASINMATLGNHAVLTSIRIT